MITIGTLKIDNPLSLAPIAGFTDSPYRTIARRHGAGLVVTELISAEGIVRKNPTTLKMISFRDAERPIGVQLFGKDPSVMGDAAGFVAEKHSPDFIDINLGCPARKVCGSGSGAALLQSPEKIFSIARSMVGAASIPVTAKIRLGLTAQNMTCFETIDALTEAGVSLVFVHGRTREQMYSGSADWSIIADIVRRSKIPIVGNGDVLSRDQALSLLEETQCAGIMIGRGAIGNPWIFSGEVPSREELRTQIREHLAGMIDYYGDYGIILFRKHIVRYIHGIHNAARMREALLAAQTVEEIEEILGGLQ